MSTAHSHPRTNTTSRRERCTDLYLNAQPTAKVCERGEKNRGEDGALHRESCSRCWSLLYSAILRSRADSLRLHVILHEWIAFYSHVLVVGRWGWRDFEQAKTFSEQLQHYHRSCRCLPFLFFYYYKERKEKKMGEEWGFRYTFSLIRHPQTYHFQSLSSTPLKIQFVWNILITLPLLPPAMTHATVVRSPYAHCVCWAERKAWTSLTAPHSVIVTPSYHWRELPQESFLSRQSFVATNMCLCFVTTKVCLSRQNIFFTTKLLLRQI